MAEVDNLRAKLVIINANIDAITSAFPALAKFKSYSKGFGEISTTYQDFGAVSQQLMKWLELKESTENKIAELTNNEGGSTLAAFRAVL